MAATQTVNKKKTTTTIKMGRQTTNSNTINQRQTSDKPKHTRKVRVKKNG